MKIDQAQVILTGAGAGIGRYLLERLLEQGAKVAVLELDATLCALVNESYQGRVKAWNCDVTDADMVDGVIASILEGGFEPNVLVNNAGIIHSEPLVNLLNRGDRVHTLASWQRVIGANLDSVFIVTRRIVERMLSKRTKGLVVSMSSIAANGNPGQTAYAASKAGVNALTMTWAKELGVMGLRFIAIAPGFMDTPSTRQALTEASLGKLKNQIPLRKLGELESIYQALQYAIENDYVTGTVLEVDGGLVL